MRKLKVKFLLGRRKGPFVENGEKRQFNLLRIGKMLHAMEKISWIKRLWGNETFPCHGTNKAARFIQKISRDSDSLWMHDDDIEEWSGALEHDLLIGQIG